jgi:tetratricopeptide (TPR) repeat protein
MRRSYLVIGGLLLLVLLPSLAVACLWDYDTLLAERSRFPSTLELITGKFLRHSPEFYEWRVKDRLKKLESDPENLAFLDDLAVAYDKLGKQDLAIELMEKKEKIKPGLYETAANHGTFHAHAGRFAEALPYLKKAIEINPDAHFGREKYQILLIEYSLAKPDQVEFAQYIANNAGIDLSQKEQLQAAVKGVLGIIRFGNHDNPKVLAALGSLLCFYHGEAPDYDAKALAARAYLKAANLSKDETQRNRFRELARMAISLQFGLELETVEAEFRRELDDANKWYEELRQRELDWIAAGTDVDAEFAKLYAEEPASLQTRSEGNLDHTSRHRRGEQRILALLIGGPIVLLAVLIGGVFALFRFVAWLGKPSTKTFEKPAP